MIMNYDIDYFIAKFTAIPDERWTTGLFDDGFGKCALGHCGGRSRVDLNTVPEAVALREIILTVAPSHWGCVASVNDGSSPTYQQSTPKARILAALHDAKAKAEAALEAYEDRPLTLTPAREQVSA